MPVALATRPHRGRLPSSRSVLVVCAALLWGVVEWAALLRASLVPAVPSKPHDA